MHITGGAFSKLKDILTKADALISHPKKLKPQEIFKEIYQKGVSSKDMYSTFNCGIGFILSAPRSDAYKIIGQLKTADIIGEVVPGSDRIQIRSAFDGNLVKL